MENIAFIQMTERKIELKIVQSRAGRYRVLEDVINQYDLTGDITKDCLFSPKSRTDILKILSIYRYTIETFNASKMIAFASNIIVKARNYRGLLDEIYTHTGMNFVLAGDDDVVKDIYQSLFKKLTCQRELAFILQAITHTYLNITGVMFWSLVSFHMVSLTYPIEMMALMGL